MKIFHYTMHTGCACDIKQLFKKYDVELKTYIPKKRNHEKYIISGQRIKDLWEEHKKDFLSSDVLIFSDTTPFSRPVLENLNLISKDVKILLWITNRFNYGIENDQEYYDLLNSIKNDSRVYFLYANKFEQYYLNNFVKLTDDSNQFFITPYGKRNRGDFNLKNKKDHHNKLFVMSYQNEKEFYPLYDQLNCLGIDFYYKNEWIDDSEYCGPYDIETCSAVLHIPYSWSTIALWEYMAISKTFILPSLNWLNKTYQTHSLFFQTYRSIEAISVFSQWYCEENKNLFVYFDKLDQIKDIINDKDLLNEKSKKCFKKVQESNLSNHAIIENILNL